MQVIYRHSINWPSLDPTVGRMALNVAMLLIVLSLISLLFVGRNSFEFMLAVAAFLVSGGFLALVSFDIRREAKMATK